ncbi:MAG TPA: hypothetical protein PL001_11625, partial [Candidatus Kryptobacter bacterium]|nr:hypothetical protein [Candidatus Kryptobacter bacterium]
MFDGMKKLLKKHSLHLGMTLLLFFVAIEIAGYLQIGGGAANSASSAGQMLMIGLFGSIVVILFLAVYLQMTLYGPVKFLSSEVKRMAERDFISLSTALTEMAQGNLTSSIKLEAGAISTSVNGH